MGELYSSMFQISVKYWNLLARLQILNVTFQNWLLIFVALGFLVVIVKSLAHFSSGSGVSDIVNKSRGEDKK